ncbi:MAG: biotin/lipoyl-containing protein, partial [Methyloceanibacter sp.]
MATEIRVPSLGESVVEATVGQWFKQAGDAVAADEPLVELETDKVTVEVPAPASGVLAEIAVKSGDTVAVGAVLGTIGDGAAMPAAAAPVKTPAPPTEPKKLEREPSPRQEIGMEEMPPSPAARKLLVES